MKITLYLSDPSMRKIRIRTTGESWKLKDLVADHPHHSQVKAALSQRDSESPAVFCRATEQSYLRSVITPKLFAYYRADSMTNSRTIRNFSDFLSQLPIISLHEKPADMRALWPKMAAHERPSPKVWMVAYLAAFAISEKLSLTTLDSYFTAF